MNFVIRQSFSEYMEEKTLNIEYLDWMYIFICLS